MMNISKEALTTRETALVLNISTNKVYELIEKEKLLAYKDEDSNAWKIPAEAIESYMEERLNARKRK